MKKAEIRKEAMRQRKALSELQVAELSLGLLEQFKRLDFTGVKTLHVFLPIAEKNEPDTFLFIEWLQAEHPDVKIIVPRADFDSALMTNHVYAGREDLQKNLYNILEPQKSALHTGDVGMVLVPLLAFDRRGYRAGYGKGFYDRFLSGLETLKVGVSFFGPVEEIEDVHENDVRLDCCITPEHMYSFD
ncbi:5-formyltetrahydrofolate cyclo-ligase [Pedobacter deserti]|uniref:5-formyltetrahydrofolate cyclo-ligase n=1 Tax=Pedobacter deserti TaxID=2817382 RepID=UPI00210A0B18|nr:5-formyltetrahydrofolate cyclo-ligase [Pedobacter sp. SYSU D00382]